MNHSILSPRYKEYLDEMRKWYAEGLLDPDFLAVDSNTFQAKATSGQVGSWFGSETAHFATYAGIMKETVPEAELAPLHWPLDADGNSYTAQPAVNMICNGKGIAISTKCKDIEAAMRYLDYIYSEDGIRLVNYGIEGVHYTPVGDDKIEYIKDENDNTLYTMDTWMSGYLPYMRFSSDAPDSQINYMTYKAENAVVSPIAGFIFDASNVQTELSNLQTEIIASIYPIKVGMVSYEDNIDQAIANLKAAGLDTYLNEYRTQFSAYLEANPWVLEMAK